MTPPWTARSSATRAGGGSWRSRGFTLIELLIIVALIGTLAALAVPAWHAMRERARVAKAIGDIRAIQTDVLGYEATHQTTPPDLAAIGRGTLRDPWGNPYRYLSFAHAAPTPPGGGKSGRGRPAVPPGARLDRFLVPINSTYDLYSMGPDGETSPPLTAPQSLDDVVRANDGAYLGLARSY